MKEKCLASRVLFHFSRQIEVPPIASNIDVTNNCTLIINLNSHSSGTMMY